MIKKGLKINCVVVVVHLCDFIKTLNSYILKRCIIKCMVVNCILINGYNMHFLRKKSSFNSWHLRSSWAHHDKVFKLIPQGCYSRARIFYSFCLPFHPSFSRQYIPMRNSSVFKNSSQENGSFRRMWISSVFFNVVFCWSWAMSSTIKALSTCKMKVLFLLSHVQWKLMCSIFIHMENGGREKYVKIKQLVMNISWVFKDEEMAILWQVFQTS